MSKTIAINAGSSSLKWQLYQMPEETVVAKGIVERIGLKRFDFYHQIWGRSKFEQIIDINDHEVAVKMLLDQFDRIEHLRVHMMKSLVLVTVSFMEEKTSRILL